MRILKPKGKIILTSQNPFTSRLILSNIGMFGHEIIWEKTQALGFFNAKKLPLRAHENIILFYNKLGTYNPIFTVGTPYTKVHRNELKTNIYHGRIRDSVKINEGIRYPRSVVKIPNPNRHSLHPTQKPVALFEYLIKTYTNEGDLVFDGFAGSGTTAVASHNLNRNFIVIEKEQEYFDLATKRLSGIRHIAQEPPVIESPT